jgi:type IV pilus assembly protein PilY1
MKNKILLTFTIFFLLTFNLYSETIYSAIPPFLQQNVYSNLYLVLDYSGSMSSNAYGNCTDNKTYYGYFDPNSKYQCNGNYNNTTYEGCSADNEYWYKNSDGISGNILNCKLMKRIDLLRYVLTGGGVSDSNTCLSNGSSCFGLDQTKCNANELCRWSYWWGCLDNRNNSCAIYTNSSSCNNNELCYWVEGGYVTTESGTRIKYEDLSNYDIETKKADGLLQKINSRNMKPRIGLVIYSTDIIETIDPTYNYDSIIASINSETAGGWTATKDGIESAKEFFESDNAYSFEINGHYGTASCTKNFILLMSDGDWNYYNRRYNISNDADPLPIINEMWLGSKADLKTSLKGNQNVQTYSVAMFLNDNSSGYKALKHFAVFGGYEDKDSNSTPCGYDTNDLNTSLTYSFPSDSCSEWDSDNDSKPDNFFTGETPDELKDAIESVFKVILQNISSGTSVAVLTDKTKKGSIMTQAVFYPDYEGIPWIGKLFAYWFYNSKTAQNIREDTSENYQLNVCGDNSDNILEFTYDDINSKLEINLFESNCNGNKDNETPIGNYESLEEIASLFEFSDYLSNSQFDNDTDSPYKNRKIYTNCDDDNTTELLNECNSSSFFGKDLGCLGNKQSLIDYVYGDNVSGCQSRTGQDGKKRILGDIVYSTPQAVDYDNVSVIYIASNDGMLHAVRLGKTVISNLPNVEVTLQNEKNDNDTDLIGQELWAFIPKNALPYLRYRAQPDGGHIYIHDLTPYIYETDNKKILIGGMRMGGGVGHPDSNSISPPSDTCSDPNSNSNCIGRSAYYALDITNPFNPTLLWEFTDEYLGFTYSGPAVIKTQKDLKDKYYVMFLSGMKNYDAEAGYTGADAKVYILGMNDNFTIAENDTHIFSVGSIDNSMNNNIVYSNRLFTNGVDFGQDSYTDAVFFAFSYQQSGDWTSNLYVAQIDDNFPNVNNFKRVMSSLHGAITANVTYMPCFNMDYVYFGTGRWFYKTDDNLGGNNKLYGINVSCLRTKNCNFNSAVNNTNICNELDGSYAKPIAWEVGLNSAETVNSAGQNIDYGKERVISDAGKMEWSNTVIFTSMQPSEDLCTYGGRSRGWGLNCATGKSIWDTSCNGYVVDTNNISCAFLQTSTASINQMCAESFAEQDGDRDVSNDMGQGSGNSSVNNVNAGQTEWYTGVTPETPPIIPPPYSGRKGKILLWMEK